MLCYLLGSFSFISTIPSHCRQVCPLQWQVEAGCFLEKVGGSKMLGKVKIANWWDFLQFLCELFICLCIQQMYAQTQKRKRRLVGLVRSWGEGCLLVLRGRGWMLSLCEALAVTESPVIWRKCHSAHIQITLDKPPPLFFTGCKLRPAGKGIEAPE